MPRAEGFDQVVECLIDAYRSILEIEEVDADSDFFKHGGHSILAGRVVARSRDELGISISLRDVFTARTPRGIAEAVCDRGALTT